MASFRSVSHVSTRTRSGHGKVRPIASFTPESRASAPRNRPWAKLFVRRPEPESGVRSPSGRIDQPLVIRTRHDRGRRLDRQLLDPGPRPRDPTAIRISPVAAKRAGAPIRLARLGAISAPIMAASTITESASPSEKARTRSGTDRCSTSVLTHSTTVPAAPATASGPTAAATPGHQSGHGESPAGDQQRTAQADHQAEQWRGQGAEAQRRGRHPEPAIAAPPRLITQVEQGDRGDALGEIHQRHHRDRHAGRPVSRGRYATGPAAPRHQLVVRSSGPQPEQPGPRQSGQSGRRPQAPFAVAEAEQHPAQRRPDDESGHLRGDQQGGDPP